VFLEKVLTTGLLINLMKFGAHQTSMNLIPNCSSVILKGSWLL
jgi:hypothetical protein